MEISAIMHRIQNIRREQDSLSAEENLLWKQFFIVADDAAGEGKPYRYLDEEQKMVIARSIATSAPFDTAAFLADPALTKAARAAVTTTRTVKVTNVDMTALDYHSKEGSRLAAGLKPLVAKHSKLVQTERRLLQPATKEEKAAIAEKRNEV